VLLGWDLSRPVLVEKSPPNLLNVTLGAGMRADSREEHSRYS
jgi:hypothetical protein